MKLFFVGMIIGIIFSYLFLDSILESLNMLTSSQSIIAQPAGHVDVDEGNTNSEKYKKLKSKNKIFGKYKGNDIEGFYIDSAGFRQIVNDSSFYGLYIQIGLADNKKKRAVQLLFSGLKLKKGTLPIDSITEKYYAIYFSQKSKANEPSYLDKINPCPGSPGCPQ